MSDLNFEGLSSKQRGLFAVRCARRVQYLMTDPRSVAALDVAERYANGQATYEELRTAVDAAMSAAVNSPSPSAWAAMTVAMMAVALDAAGAAAEVVEVAGDAARAAARDAELAAQQKILDEIRAAINELEGET